MEPRTLQFWKNCGSKIKSLLLLHYMLPEETIKCIIKYCVRMEYFTIENTSSRWRPCAKGEKICSSACLEELIDSGIRRNNLRYFGLRITSSGWISNNFLHVFFTIYPNIDKFSFFIDDGNGEKFCSSSDIAHERLHCLNYAFTFCTITWKLRDSKERIKEIDLALGRYRFQTWYILAPLTYFNVSNYNFYYSYL